MAVALAIPRDGFASFSNFFRQLKNSGYRFSDDKAPKLLENVYFVFKENDVDEEGRPRAQLLRETDLASSDVDVTKIARPSEGMVALLVWQEILGALAFGYQYAAQVNEALLDLQQKGIIK